MATESFLHPWHLTPEQAEYLLDVLDDETEGVTVPDEDVAELERGEALFKQRVLNSDSFWKSSRPNS